MIEAIIFDVGGVLVRTEDHAPRRQWDARLGLPPGQTETLVFNSDRGQMAQRGEISDEDLWLWIAEHLQLGDQAAAFREAFWAGDVLDDNLVHLIRSLRPSYQTAIISNATDGLLASLTRLGIVDAFDVIIGSAEEGIMKPDPRIYRRALDKLGRRPSEALFIDDFAHNIAGARDVGLAAIHYQPGLDLAAALTEFGVSAPQNQESDR